MAATQLNSVLSEVLEVYKNVGIHQLAEYQRDILEDLRFYPPDLNNLLISAPTASGKNLVVEILALVNVRLTKKKCMFVGPYVAACREVFFNLQQTWREFGLNVKAHFGTASTSPNDEFDAIVCTIEKAAAFVNRLLREDTLGQYCCMVIDEAHMILDQDRGGLLEDIVVKLKYCRAVNREVPQLICMSATLESPQQICRFIDAHFIEHKNRLNRLYEFGVVDKKLYKVGSCEHVADINPLFNIASDKNAAIGLTVEALIENKSILIFCMTKAFAEQTAYVISSYIRFINSKPNNRFPQLRELGASDALNLFSDKMKILLRTGVAFHHSGLSCNERSEIEKLYRRGQIRMISCTTTLSTGVNLPAARVIVRLDQGPMNINFINYNQMIGRCGRNGDGQAFVIAQSIQKLTDAWKLIQKRPFAQIKRDFTQLILDAASSKLVKTKDECEKLVFLAIQQPLVCVRDTISYLVKHKFFYTSNDTFVVNQLGLAASQSFLNPSDALFICTELEKAARNLCLDTELHLAYLITPLKNKTGIDVKKIPWHNFFNLFDKLTGEYSRVAELVGVNRASCIDALNGSPKVTLVRFYLALILMEALRGVPIKHVLQKYEFKMADLEVLRDQALLYARTVVGMCECLAWPYLRNVLGLFSKKLELWACPETCDLMKIKGMDGTRARSFIERGITTAQELAVAELTNVERVLRRAVPFLIDADGTNGDQNEWLSNERIDSCSEAAKILTERAQQIASIQREVLRTRKAVEEECWEESSIGLLEQNITLDASMSDMSDMSDEPSMIEFDNNENRILGNLNYIMNSNNANGMSSNSKSRSTSRCMTEILNCRFVVFEFVGGQFVLMTNNNTVFNICLDPSRTCTNGCCSSNSMLETFLYGSVPKYSYNLSLTFHNARDFLTKKMNIELNAHKMATNFYCISTLLRVRLKKCPSSLELLNAEMKNGVNSSLAKKEHVDKTHLTMVGYLKLVEGSLLNSDADLEPLNEFGRHLNSSVLTSVFMSYRGFTFNQVQYQKLTTYIMQEIPVAEKSAWRIAGEKFNLYNGRSTRQMLDKLGIPSTGKPTTITIAELEHVEHPIASSIIRARRLNHANKVLRRIHSMVGTEGRTHPYYNCLSCCTGRIYAESPELQFVPKERYLNGESCRSVFCAQPGHILLALDFKQVELRMLAVLSRDENLRELVQNDLDPFEQLVTTWPLNRDQKKKGMGKKALSQEIGCSIEDAGKIASEIFQYFHGVRAWMEDVVSEATRNKFVKSIWNLSISTQNMTDYEIQQKVPHFIIQASVSEIIRKILNDVENTPSEGTIVMQMHDEFILEVREERATQCAKIVKELMQFRLDDVFFPVTIKRGQNWDCLE